MERAAERVVAILSNDDDRALLTAAVWELLDAALATPAERKRARRPGSHAVCELFEDLTVALDELLSVPGLLVDTAVDAVFDHLSPQWLPRAVTTTVLKKLVDVVLAADPGTLALQAMALKTSALAVALCPNTDQHPSLEQTCAPRILRAAADPVQPHDE